MVFRLFTGLLPSIAAVAVAAVAIAEERDGHQAPNILFVYTDDQRWDAMGVVQAEQGNSWKPLLTQSNPKWHQQFYYEYHTDRQFPAVPRVQALRTEAAKFIVYPGHDWVELYDLAKDPLETRNLAKDPAAAALLDAMTQRFLEEQQRVNAAPGKQPAQKESWDHT